MRGTLKSWAAQLEPCDVQEPEEGFLISMTTVHIRWLLVWELRLHVLSIAELENESKMAQQGWATQVLKQVGTLSTTCRFHNIDALRTCWNDTP